VVIPHRKGSIPDGEALGAELARFGPQPLAHRVELVDLDASVGVDHRPLPGLMRLPPVADQGAVAVVSGLERLDAVVLGVGGDRLLEVAGADVVDCPLLPRLDLPAVHRQLGRAEAEAQGAEAAAGLDGGELAVVADQHHLDPRLLCMLEEGGELPGGDHGRLIHHQHRPPVQLHPAMLEVEQQPVDRAGVDEALISEADGGDPGRGGAEDLVAVQLEGLPGQPQCPGLTRPGPPDHDGHASAALGEVAHHGRLVLPGAGMPVEDLTDHLGAHHGAALVRPAGGAVDQMPLQGQQLRGRVAVDAQPTVAADPDRPLGQEPVGRLLNLGQRLVSGGGDREALGQGVHHVRPDEGGRLSGQTVRAGQGVQGGVQLCPGRWPAPSTRADLGQLALTHPLLRQLGPPAGIDALLRLCVVLRLAGGHRRRAGRLDPGQALLGEPLVDLLRALAEPLNECPVVQANDLGGARAFVHRSPADTQALGQRGPLGSQVQVIGGHQMRVQPVAVQGRPPSVRSLSGVLDEHMGVAVGVA
jgi:hypothetical protein